MHPRFRMGARVRTYDGRIRGIVLRVTEQRIWLRDDDGRRRSFPIHDFLPKAAARALLAETDRRTEREARQLACRKLKWPRLVLVTIDCGEGEEARCLALAKPGKSNIRYHVLPGAHPVFGGAVLDARDCVRIASVRMTPPVSMAGPESEGRSQE